MIFNGTALVCLIYLVIAVVDDLCFKKFHNWIFLSLSFFGFSFVIYTGTLATDLAIYGFFTGGLVMLPLVLMGAIGAGDMKFMMCLGILMGPLKIFEVFLYALFWGALIGVLQIFLSGKIMKLKQNLTLMSVRIKPTDTHKIPYTVAILFAWFSFHFYGGFL